jgi:exodeoxyribonuclease-3
MRWEDDLKNYVKELEKKKPVIICGDFNVAHTPQDIKNAKANIGHAGFTDEERNKFTDLLNSGFIDTYRHFNPTTTDKYSWWSYMGNARLNNVGWRIDYFLVSNSIIDKVISTNIYDDVYGSDHCPIGIDINLD